MAFFNPRSIANKFVAKIEPFEQLRVLSVLQQVAL